MKKLIALLLVLAGIYLLTTYNQSISGPVSSEITSNSQGASTVVSQTPPLSANTGKSSEFTASITHTNSEAYACAIAIVKSYLESPSSAKFCKITEMTITHIGNYYTVKGYVDVEYDTGNTIRQDFTVNYTATSGGYKDGTVDFSINMTTSSSSESSKTTSSSKANPSSSKNTSISKKSYSELTNADKKAICNYIESRYSYYDSIEGGYTGDKYSDKIWKETAL